MYIRIWLRRRIPKLCAPKLEQKHTKNGVKIKLNQTEYLTTEREPVKNLEIDDDEEIKDSKNLII